MEVYLDNSATTRVFPETAELVKNIMCEEYGNPSSLHRKGLQAENRIREAKEILAGILKVDEKELFFTSGGTESDNLALIGSALANQRRGKRLITTQVEHPAVLQAMKYLESLGFQVTYLPVDHSGRIWLDDLRNAMTDDTILVSIMHTNNEVGSLQPIAEAGTLVKRMNPNTLFHVDAVQGFGKARIYPRRMNVDLLSASSHKIHGPKGVGLLYVRDKVKIQSILFGGGQQRNLRSGTENVPGVSGMANSARMLYSHLEEDVNQLYRCKRYFVEGLDRIEGVRINGLTADGSWSEGTAPHIVSAAFPGVRSEVLLHALEDKGIYVSAGSACAARKPQPSATLKAMKAKEEILESTIRFSFSVFTTIEQLEYTLRVLEQEVPERRKYARK